MRRAAVSLAALALATGCRTLPSAVPLSLAGLLIVLLLGGCNDAQRGSLLGASAGALAGQALGHDSDATLLGAGIGGAVGYAIGHESDRRKRGHRYDHQRYDRRCYDRY